MKKILAFVIAALGMTRPIIAAPQPKVIVKPVPVLIRVPNGFPIPSRTNGKSRKRKSNRLHLSTQTRNKHR